MKHFLLIAAFLPLLAAAADSDGDFHVLVNPKVYDPRAFEGKGAAVGTLPEPGNNPGSLPSHEKRERAFQRVPGLPESVAKMDELDRDLLYMRAKTKSLKDLKRLYPKLKEKQLTQLKKEVARKQAETAPAP